MSRPVPAPNYKFYQKKEGFKPSLTHRESVCPMDLNWKLVPESGCPVAEGSASQITFRDPRNYLYASILGVQHSTWVIRHYKFFKIQRYLTI